MASRLAAALDGASGTPIDPRMEHRYQPGCTLVAASSKPQNHPVADTGSSIPRGVQRLAETVAEIDPEGKRVVSGSGKSIPHDFLIVAPGRTLNHGGFKGMDPA